MGGMIDFAELCQSIQSRLLISESECDIRAPSIKVNLREKNGF